MRGHEEASGIKYVPKKLLDKWAKKDPILNYEKFLIDSKILTDKNIDSIKKDISREIDLNINKAFDEKNIISTIDKELNDVYRDFNFKQCLAISTEEINGQLVGVSSIMNRDIWPQHFYRILNRHFILPEHRTGYKRDSTR